MLRYSLQSDEIPMKELIRKYYNERKEKAEYVTFCVVKTLTLIFIASTVQPARTWYDHGAERTKAQALIFVLN